MSELQHPSDFSCINEIVSGKPGKTFAQQMAN